MAWGGGSACARALRHLGSTGRWAGGRESDEVVVEGTHGECHFLGTQPRETFICLCLDCHQDTLKQDRRGQDYGLRCFALSFSLTHPSIALHLFSLFFHSVAGADTSALGWLHYSEWPFKTDGCIYIDMADDLNVLRRCVRHFVTAKGLILRPLLIHLRVVQKGIYLEENRGENSWQCLRRYSQNRRRLLNC